MLINIECLWSWLRYTWSSNNPQVSPHIAGNCARTSKYVNGNSCVAFSFGFAQIHFVARRYMQPDKRSSEFMTWMFFFRCLRHAGDNSCANMNNIASPARNVLAIEFSGCSCTVDLLARLVFTLLAFIWYELVIACAWRLNALSNKQTFKCVVRGSRRSALVHRRRLKLHSVNGTIGIVTPLQRAVIHEIRAERTWTVHIKIDIFRGTKAIN